MGSPDTNKEALAAGVAGLGLEPVVEAAGETPVYLVGGAVRDLLLGREPLDVDLAVEGDAIQLAGRVAEPEADVAEYGRFGTATVAIGGREVNLAATRAEDYAHPGALPEVRPAPIADDLSRRDFTVNAMAVRARGAGRPSRSPWRRRGPRGGPAAGPAFCVVRRRSDAGSARGPVCGALRVRAETETEAALRAADLGTVSAERVEADLARLTAEEKWRAGFELLEGWGLVEGGDPELMGAVADVLDQPRWRGSVPHSAAMLVAGPRAGRYAPAPGPLRDAGELVGIEDGPPSSYAAAARGASPLALVLARAMGAEWLDRWVDEWRDVRLEITGEDLMAAGVPEGPAVGVGLSAALDAKLDGQVRDKEEELQTALAAAART